MKYLVTAEEMKLYDRQTMEKIGICGEVLMERAALKLQEVLQDKFKGEKKKRHILILAGTGNNGGDGLALARLLAEDGCGVDVVCVGDADRATPQWKLEKRILSHYNVAFLEDFEGREYDACVDALFGVGLKRNVEGKFKEVIEKANEKNGLKLSVDIPSGISADTGRVLGCGFRADITVTFGFAKRGLYFYPGCEYAGEVVIAKIGIDETSFFGRKPGMFYLDEKVEDILPGRKPDGNKGTFKKALIVAGSYNMAGAAILSAKACYRSGVGMVKVITPPENRVILQEKVPEALLGDYGDLKNGMEWADVILIGCGLSQSEEAYHVLGEVLERAERPMVLDADALNLVSVHGELKERIRQKGEMGQKIIMTPHLGELARLMDMPVEKIKENVSLVALDAAKEYNAVIVAKDARTFVCETNKPVCANVCGTSGMATAGSGDVLAGCITAFLAQQMDPYEAACRGVYVHARAGEMAGRKLGDHAMMAMDIAEHLCRTRL